MGADFSTITSIIPSNPMTHPSPTWPIAMVEVTTATAQVTIATAQVTIATAEVRRVTEDPVTEDPVTADPATAEATRKDAARTNTFRSCWSGPWDFWLFICI